MKKEQTKNTVDILPQTNMDADMLSILNKVDKIIGKEKRSDKLSAGFEAGVGKPTCNNCKHLITREADKATKVYGFDEEYFCGKYEKFVNGLPTLMGKHDRLSVNVDEYRFSCKYHKYK